MIPSKETIAALMALGPDDPATPINGCHCDFCTLKKRYSDNWCARCTLVKMDPPKWWENMDMCDECEKIEAAEMAGHELVLTPTDADKIAALLNERPGPTPAMVEMFTPRPVSEREGKGEGCWYRKCEDESLEHLPFLRQAFEHTFIVCPDCGNKRCPKAQHHDRACTRSNVTGQPGGG